jgi:type IV secretory pathway TraG/TraD family ATPase VirD4
MLRERLTMKYVYGPMVRIPVEDEPRHMLLEGNTGGGKSAAIRQLAVQIAERDEGAIIYDPAREYTERFYSPERGDIILNPLDVRAPYWSPGEEVEHDAVALTIAHALFPDRPNESHFFWESVRKLIAHLLRLHPRPEQLVEWMNDPSEIDRRVQGTPYASTISRNSPQQRDGVLGTMSLVADTVRLLKSEREAKRHWTAREWVKRRQGWIFLTCTPETRDALRPLISLWLDLLILRLLHEPAANARRVWFLLDELGSLQKLPQLVTAVTENRKSNNPVVIGIQGKAQLETIYGHIAETMLSMP